MIDDTYLTGKVGLSGEHPFVDHFRFVKQFENEQTIAKQTIPSPAQFLAQFTMPFNREETEKYYDSDAELVNDIVAGYGKVIDDLYAAGCRNLQLDDCTWGMFADKIGLTGKQALVYPAFAAHNPRIRRDLITSTKHHHIIAHQLIEQQLRFRAIAQRMGFRTGYDGQLVGDALRTDLLNDSDNGVAHDDHHEQHVLVRPREQHDKGQNGVHQVEQRTYVVMDDLPDRARFHARIDIGLARDDTHLRFFGCETKRSLYPSRLVHSTSLQPAPRHRGLKLEQHVAKKATAGKRWP